MRGEEEGTTRREWVLVCGGTGGSFLRRAASEMEDVLRILTRNAPYLS